MKTAYILTDGSYSEYHIVKVFSSKEKAERYIEQYKLVNDDCPRIEDYEVDESDDEFFARQSWQSFIFYPTGELHEYGGRINLGKETDKFIYYHSPNNKGVTVLSFISQEHATKLATEKRQEYLRSTM